MSHDAPTPEQEHAAGLHERRAVRWCRDCAIAMQHAQENHWSREAAEALSVFDKAPQQPAAPVPAHQESLEAIRTLGIHQMLIGFGEDPNREGLRDTPKRVIKAWKEMTRGYSARVEDFLTTFENEGTDTLILDGPIQFYSTCEHHLLPFWGSAWVGYIPSDKLVGLSKLARVVDMFSRRLQNQERMTSQIADALASATGARGTTCLVRAQHMCRMARGVSQPEAMMTTSALRGVFLTDAAARAEFFSMVSK